MSWPFVSLVCATYNRPPLYLHLLEEIVESFRRAAALYPGRSELVLISDAPGQRLTCDVPGVRVLNFPQRFASLGAKLNVGIGLAQGEVIVNQDDDDLSLPHRLVQAVEHLGTRGYWNPQALWYWERGQPPRRDHGGACHNASCFRKDAWLRVGGYPPVSGSQDAALDSALRRVVSVAPPLGPDETPGYVYRWGNSDLHLSGQHDTERAYREHGTRPVAAGAFAIVPRWRQDTEVALAPLCATS